MFLLEKSIRTSNHEGVVNDSATQEVLKNPIQQV